MVVFINTLKVEPQNQDRLIEILKESVNNVISKQPGYLSSRIFKSRDGKTVHMFAEWRSVQDIEATRNNPKNAGYLKLIQEVGAQASPGVYEPVFTEGKNE